MLKLAQFRNPDLSLFQSAVDEVVARKTAVAQSQNTGGPAAITRPDPSHDMVKMATAEATAATQGGAAPPAASPTPAPAATEDFGDQVAYCASLARNYAVAKLLGHTDDANRYQALLTAKDGDCDPGWAEASLKYEEFLVSKGTIPYRVYKSMTDYVIDGKLPHNARVAIRGRLGNRAGHRQNSPRADRPEESRCGDSHGRCLLLWHRFRDAELLLQYLEGRPGPYQESPPSRFPATMICSAAARRTTS